MEIYIDTANMDEIKKYAEYGIIDGVTTNPALMAKEGNKDIKKIIEDISKYVKGPLSVEVISEVAEGILEEARKINELGDNIVVKVPAIPEGFKALSKISKEGIKTNVTMVYTVNQALLAAKMGATYVSPFVGRSHAEGGDGPKLINEISEIYKIYNFKTKILAASMRNVIYVKQAALAGADIATIPPSVLNDMMQSDLCDNALKGFLRDWNKLHKGKTMLGDDIYESRS